MKYGKMEKFNFLTDKRLSTVKFINTKILKTPPSINLSITHEIYQSFDEGFDVRIVFLDISKAFDKLWHDGIIFKLKQNGISGNLLNLLSNFLKL